MEIVIGKAKTGKTSYLFDLADKYVKEGKKVIYLVPSQMRVVTEENYLKYNNESGILGINFTTISSFVKEYIALETIKNKENYITGVDRKLILATLLSNSKINFNIFSKVKNKEGFIDNLSIYMDIFKKGEFENKDIENLNLDNKLLEYKLKELNLIYKEYKDFIGGKFIDDLDEMDFFNNKFLSDFKNKYSRNIDNYVYIFDSYNNFTRKEFTFISNLIKLGFNIKFGILSDIVDKVEGEDFVDKSLNEIMTILTTNELSSIYDIPNLTVLNLIKECKILNSEIFITFKLVNYFKSNNDIKYLGSNIFSNKEVSRITSENVYLNLYSNIYEESKAIARSILKYIDMGYKFKDIAVISANIDEYEYSINKTFLEYNIPVHIDSKKKLSSNFLVRYITNLLKLITVGLKKEILLEVLKSGLLDMDFKDISYLENYILEFNIEGFKFNNKFRANNVNNGKIYDLERLNNIRSEILDIFSDFDEIKSSRNISGKEISKEDTENDCDKIIKCIYTHLERNNILINYFTNIEDLKESNNSKIMYLGKLNEEGYNYLVNVFDSISKIYKDIKLNLKDFSKIFNIAVKEFKLKSIAPTIDEISLVDINSAKLTTKKIIFFVGMNENIFPSAISNDILFNDSELSYLDEEDIKIKETSITKTNMELFNFYGHLNNVTDKIHISFLSSDSLGSSLRISNVIGKILNILDGKILGNVAMKEDITVDNIKCKMEALELLSLNFKNKDEINNEILGIYKYLVSNKDYDEVIKYNRETKKLNKESVEKLYKEKINLSVSRLELFSKCPFAYHLQYNLKLDERKIYTISTMDIGSLMHGIIENFSYYLLEKGINWQDILKEEVKYNKIIEKIILTEIDTTFIKYEDNIKYMVLKQKLISSLKKVIMMIAKSYESSQFKPLGYEINFDEKGEYTPFSIELDNGKIVNLIGKIDRVDILETEDTNYLRIVDYKSSDKKYDVNYIKEKVSLQLITYMTAMMNNLKGKGKKIKPAGMVYFTLSERLINIEKYEDDEDKIKEKLIKALRLKGIFLKDIKIMELMDKNIGKESSLIEVSKKTLEANKTTLNLIPEEDFDGLCDEIKSILKEISEELVGGDISMSIRPNPKKDHCQYCNYRNICRKENQR